MQRYEKYLKITIFFIFFCINEYIYIKNIYENDEKETNNKIKRKSIEKYC